MIRLPQGGLSRFEPGVHMVSTVTWKPPPIRCAEGVPGFHGPRPPAIADSTIAANGVKIWDWRLRQEEPLRGPVTLIYADGPMMLSSQGPQRMAMMQQESHLSNAAVLCRVQMLASHPRFFNPFVLEGERYDLCPGLRRLPIYPKPQGRCCVSGAGQI